MSPFLRDLRRLVDGASLVAFQAFKQSTTAFKPSESESFLSNAFKSAFVYATDVAGITSGRIRRYSSADVPPLSAHEKKGSVIYFSDPPPETATHPLQTPESIHRETLSHTQALVSVSAPQEQATANGEATEPISIYKNFNAPVDLVVDQTRVTHSVLLEAESPTDHNASLLIGTNEKPDVGGGRASSLKRRRPRERKVPSTPLGRALGFAGLGASLAWGTVQESTRRFVYGTPNSNEKQSALSPFLSEKNAERLALALCRMRGAALKLGQMLSIQDESLVPAPILSALDIVRQGADVMPRSQLNDVLDSELGFDWTKKLKSFDYEPLASASIGQVHRAVLKDGLEVAMKIQYPGVADSIDSDIDNARRLLDYTNLIPKGFFLDRAIKVAKEELSRECDYELEASNQKRFRELLLNTEGVYVPMVIDEISNKRVLTTELIMGIPIDKVANLNQETRNYVGKKLLELTLKELFVFRFMQTDPNWSNFLYDEATNKINLIDFGAAREYRKGFVDDYLRMVLACANRDRPAVIEMSTRLGFLTGMESEVMLNAHVQASFIVGLPFSNSGTYDFRSSNITSSISHLGATMLKHRLTPPPDEAYSLHRKLSGAFLACIKLGAVVPCRDLLLQVYQQYRFSDENEETLSSLLA